MIRLVRRLSSLRRIVNALASSVVPMCSAFSVLFLVSSIYSVIGVDLFGAKDAAYFGTYSASLFTMFQVCTFDDWSDVARDESGNVDFQTAAFFISFVVVVGWIILNVVSIHECIHTTCEAKMYRSRRAGSNLAVKTT